MTTETMYHFTGEQLYKLLNGVLEMMVEYRDVHAWSEEAAKGAAALEMLEGLDSELEMFAAGDASKLSLQSVSEPYAELERVRKQAAAAEVAIVNLRTQNTALSQINAANLSEIVELQNRLHAAEAVNQERQKVIEELRAEVERLRRVLMNIESATRIHAGIPWEAMVMTLQDIARNGLKEGKP